jgi:hypothetical protein
MSMGAYEWFRARKKRYHPRSNLVKDENGDLLADSYKALNR